MIRLFGATRARVLPSPNERVPNDGLGGLEIVARVDTDPTGLLLKEYEQAWLHYRHAESIRSQYLGFFFTMVLGSFAFVATLAKDRSVISPELLFQLCVLLWALFHATAVIYLSVVKQGSTRQHYDTVRAIIRTLMYRSLPKEDKDVLTMIDIFSVPHPHRDSSPLSKYFSLQANAETLLSRFMTLAVALQVGGLLLALFTLQISDPLIYVLVCILTVNMWWSWLTNRYYVRAARREVTAAIAK